MRKKEVWVVVHIMNQPTITLQNTTSDELREEIEICKNNKEPVIIKGKRINPGRIMMTDPIYKVVEEPQKQLEWPKLSEEELSKKRRELQQKMLNDPWIQEARRKRLFERRKNLLQWIREIEEELWLDITEDLALEYKEQKVKEWSNNLLK